MERESCGLKEDFIRRMQEILDVEFEEFIESLESRSPISIRYNPYKQMDVEDMVSDDKVPWTSNACYLAERPSFTLDPAFHAGHYYVQEAASMFCLNAIRQVLEPTENSLRILDLCAAPGGKSTLMSELGSDHLLVCNEVIRSRCQILKENIEKWGIVNRVVTQCDVSELVKLGAFFDIILVDAPCSGEGMFRKDPAAREEWSEDLVKLCKGRQKRILTDAVGLLKPGGLLVYSTCTFNTEENEDNVVWLENNFQLTSCALETDPSWEIKNSLVEGIHAYRFYPHHTRSEGFFISVLRSDDGPSTTHKRLRNSKNPLLTKLNRKEIDSVSQYFERERDHVLFRDEHSMIRLIDKEHWEAVNFIKMKIGRSDIGLPIGELKKKDFVPSHSLAMSGGIKLHYPVVELSLKQALTLLKKEKLDIDYEKNSWLLAQYKALNLAWLKKVPGRINNYLPKGNRIRMEIDLNDQWD